MRWQCKVWHSDSSDPVSHEFLSTTAISYLRQCEDEVFEEWHAHFPSDKSLANVLSRTVLSKFDNDKFGLSDVFGGAYAVVRAFHHQKSTADLWVGIFQKFNHENVSAFLVLTQSQAFKDKFLYDSATMSLDSLIQNYSAFLNALKLVRKPTVYFLAFDDLDFRTDVLNRGSKKFLVLERN